MVVRGIVLTGGLADEPLGDGVMGSGYQVLRRDLVHLGGELAWDEYEMNGLLDDA